MKSEKLPDDLERIVLSLLEGLATPRSVSVAILVRYGEWDQLTGLSVLPKHYVENQADKFFRDTQATALLRKYRELPTTVDRKKVAVENFWKSEASCYRANERLSPYLSEPLMALESTVVGRVILLARKMISESLGPYSDISVSAGGRFGPGATFGDKGVLSTVPDKMSSEPTLTNDAIPWLFPWTGTAWARACATPVGVASRDHPPRVVPGNRFVTVPKDCTKDRGIAIEPSINVFYQLGLGSLIRKRLKRNVGLDILHAQDLHRRVAREASIKGHLATIDLSNASDTVCSNLVKLLLPERWFEALSSLRSPKTFIDGRWVVLEKFSSMGNGYTFELETLLFLALCHATLQINEVEPLVGSNLLVYGDDIIIPSECGESVISVLRFFGFETNKLKSFVEGPFKESCGGDYFEGTDVRPYYLKESLNAPEDFIAFANGLRRVGTSVPRMTGRWSRLRRAWFQIADLVPSTIRSCRGPTLLGDLVFADEESKWRTRERHGIRYIRVWRPARWRRIGWDHFHPDVVLASALYEAGSQIGHSHSVGQPTKGTEGVTPRDSVIGFKLGWVPYS